MGVHEVGVGSERLSESIFCFCKCLGSGERCVGELEGEVCRGQWGGSGDMAWLETGHVRDTQGVAPEGGGHGA